MVVMELATVSAVNFAGGRDGAGRESGRRRQGQELTVMGRGIEKEAREGGVRGIFGFFFLSFILIMLFINNNFKYAILIKPVFHYAILTILPIINYVPNKNLLTSSYINTIKPLNLLKCKRRFE